MPSARVLVKLASWYYSVLFISRGKINICERDLTVHSTPVFCICWCCWNEWELRHLFFSLPSMSDLSSSWFPDVEMADGSQRTKFLKPLGKKMKKKLKIAKKKNHGKGKIRKKNIWLQVGLFNGSFWWSSCKADRFIIVAYCKILSPLFSPQTLLLHFR